VRRLSSLLVAVLAALTCLSVTLPAAHAGPGESEFTSRTNAERSSRGIRTYAVRSDLVAVARRHAARMAARGSIYHNPNLAGEVSGWQAVGENVGMGGDVASIHQAFMNSSGHRANILDRGFTEVGMGTATDSQGRLYVTQVFRTPDGSATAAPAPTQPRPAVQQPAPTTTRTKATAPRRAPVARRLAPAKPAVDPAKQLAARLAAARAVAGRTRSGVLHQAVGYHDVMRTLAG
jgi:hypothetical protein